ncbi:MAG: SPASM domain-containing protein [Candidatus Omnitrophica bacterium]|nr:SPASM domain-containing protein [Candidatus Omnitrophota bacterium]
MDKYTQLIAKGLSKLKRNPVDFCRTTHKFFSSILNKHLSRRLIWQEHVPRTMREVHVDVVSGCQLRCLGCPNSTMEKQIKHTPVGDFSRYLNNIDIAHIKLLRLYNFGEPVLHPELADIVKEIPKQSWKVDKVEISTNGQYLDEKMIQKVFSTDVINTFFVSCDGDGTASEYERLRPPAKWSMLLDFLKVVKEIRDSCAPDIALLTRTCCTDKESRNRWIDLLRPLGWEPEFRTYDIFPQSVKNLLGRNPVVPEEPCLFLEAGRLYVDWDGTVVPCCAHPKAFELGNLGKQKYSEIFEGKKRKSFLQVLRNRKKVAVCNECEF